MALRFSSCDHLLVTTVLIVDDHPSFRRNARALLEAEGFDVVGEAEDGREAIDAAEKLHPDVVLLDVQLPDLDGFEVASSLTREDALTCVILVSSREGSDFGLSSPRAAPEGSCRRRS
jgi:DNA-binding NarL/FixJ family response regulator